MQQFRPQPPRLNPQPQRRRIFPIIFWTFLIIFLIILGSLFAKAYNVSTKIFGSNHSFFGRIAQLAISHGGTELQGEAQGQINILLLGYGGPNHDGPYLTDSMILASIKPASKQILLTSIPRDYLWRSGSGDEQKINQAFADGIGSHLNFDAAGANARGAAESVSGESIPYYVSLDFQGFVDAINKVGGVDLTIDRTFTDDQFPNDATNGYLPPQTFLAGPAHMDGERALIFARSRHAEGVENGDFARSKRQEKVIGAFRDKVNSLNLVKDSSTYNALLNILTDHFHTNIEPDQMLHLAQMIKGSDFQILSQTLDNSSGLICNGSTTDGIFILQPCTGTTDAQIQDFFKNGFQSAQLGNEHASVIIENMGTDNALYGQVLNNLHQAGSTIYEVPYRGIALTQSVLYEISPAPLTEKFIEDQLHIAVQPKPAQMVAHANLVLFVGAPGNSQ